MAAIAIQNVSHLYASADGSKTDVAALRDVTFSVKSGEACAIVGPSGCGKSTLLRVAAGLLKPTRGSVMVDETQVTEPSSSAALVFQEYSRSLFPWLTVEENVSLAVEQAKLKPGAASRQVTDYLDAVGLAPARRRYPWQLSGGMQQRVAIARALAIEPRVLLLDEPFGSLDALTRFALEDLVLQTQERFGLSLLLVTHDVDEAVYMADRVFVMEHGGHLSSTSGIDVSLSRPRHQAATRQTARFAEMREHLLAELGVLPQAS